MNDNGNEETATASIFIISTEPNDPEPASETFRSNRIQAQANTVGKYLDMITGLGNNLMESEAIIFPYEIRRTNPAAATEQEVQEQEITAENEFETVEVRTSEPEPTPTPMPTSTAALLPTISIFNCLICYKSYNCSTTFSIKNNLSSNYCLKVFKSFCKILQIQSEHELDELIWNYQLEHQFPLPFCESCSEHVVGLVKLQDELEQLQETLAFEANDIKIQIRETEFDRQKELIRSTNSEGDQDGIKQRYDNVVEELRIKAIRDFVPQVFPIKPELAILRRKEVAGKKKGNRFSKNIKIEPESEPTTVKLESRPQPASYHATVVTKDEIVQSQEHDYGHTENAEESTTIDSDLREITESSNVQEMDMHEYEMASDLVDSSSSQQNDLKTSQNSEVKSTRKQIKTENNVKDETDPEFLALVNELSVRTRRNILKKRFKGKKTKVSSSTGNSNNSNLRDRFPVVTTEGKMYCDNVEIIKEEDDNNGGIKYKCGFCGYKQKQLLKVKRHIRLGHKNGTVERLEFYECKMCGKKFKNLDSLPRHKKIYHSDGQRTMYTCDFCGKTLKSARSIKSHQALVHSHGVDNYGKCDICGRPFSNNKTMKIHRLTHMNEEERQITLYESQQHQQHASSEMDKPEVIVFTCTICGKTCATEAGLKSHELIHTDETPFVCDICGKGFRHKCNLQAHLETHQGEERSFRYSCEFCGRQFSTKSQLVHHSFNHRPDEEKPFKCSSCNACFVRSHDLSVHRRKHTGEKPYTCVICLKSFTRSYHLTRHCRSVHNVDHTTIITAEIIDPELVNIELTVTENENGTFTAIV